MNITNPWDLLVWVIVICLALIAIAVTYATVRGLLRGADRRPERSTPVIKPSGRQR